MNQDKVSNFREHLRTGAVNGVFSKTSDPAMVEATGYSGLDFIILDLEHGPNSVESLQGLIRAAEISGILPIVRVKEGQRSVIGEVLDVGAAGIQVPQVTSASEAEEVISLAKFAPAGMRGVCRFVRAASYSSMDRFKYFEDANNNLIILQLEGEEALRNLDEILQVNGIDVLFIGPYDLSQSLGVPGQVNHPKVEEQMKKIVMACEEAGIAVGTFVDTIENAGKWKQAGVSYIAYSVDVGLFYDACKQLNEQLTAL